MKKSDLKAISLLLLPVFSGALLFYSIFQENIFLYILGQVAGVIFFFQSFILVHEFGHNSLFKTNSLNTLFGYLFSIFTLIPFYNWKTFHSLHHKWTGYRDKDPTTEKTFYSRLTPITKKVCDIAWRFHIPVFTIGYRFGIYWSFDKMRRFLNEEQRKKAYLSSFAYILFYLIIVISFPLVLVKILPALIVSFSLTDILSMSQHSHIAMKHSEGQSVTALKYKAQGEYSRTLMANKTFSLYVLFNMNYHVEHHCYPGLPCYFLTDVEQSTGVRYNLWYWVKAAKALEGSYFIFDTGKYDI